MEYEYDYWPSGGLRTTGSHLFSVLSLRTLNRILPCDLYLSGPHHYSYWELNVSYDYGRYNPEAVKYLNQLASKMVADKKFVEKTQPIVDKYLQEELFTMMALYDGLNNKDLCSDKQEILVNSMENEGHTYGDAIAAQFIENLTKMDNNKHDFCNEIEMCLYWWARRNSDDTMDLFHDGLKTIYDAYYPAE